MRVALRTAHIIGFSVLFGGHWFGLPREILAPWLYCSVLSGAALMAMDLRKGFDWLFQAAGVMTLVKILILALVPVFWGQRLVLLTLVMVIGSVGSHMPGVLRHFYLLPIRKKSV